MNETCGFRTIELPNAQLRQQCWSIRSTCLNEEIVRTACTGITCPCCRISRGPCSGRPPCRPSESPRACTIPSARRISSAASKYDREVRESKLHIGVKRLARRMGPQLTLPTAPVAPDAQCTRRDPCPSVQPKQAKVDCEAESAQGGSQWSSKGTDTGTLVG
jgi:hypothetical protein